jgi:decaprenyl-phosphate phosphoribosyltransferase
LLLSGIIAGAAGQESVEPGATVGAEVSKVPSRHTGLRALVHAARPRQWVKNLLVFVAPAAAGVLRHPDAFLRTLATFGIFCLAASGTYLLNDVVDAEADRLHPDKAHRPIASGALSPSLAAATSAVLLASALACSFLLAGWPLGLVIGIYVVINVAYSLRLKREPVVELAAVASGFVLRAIAGGVATHVGLSSWFLVVISFGALFLVIGKRSAEHATLGEARGSHRQVLSEYSTSFLEAALTLTAAVTATAYCLWAFDRGGLAERAGHRLVWIELTVVPMILGVLYVLRLLDAGKGGAPEELALNDHFLQVLGVVWAVCLVIGLYG